MYTVVRLCKHGIVVFNDRDRKGYSFIGFPAGICCQERFGEEEEVVEYEEKER
jgi:hypothetical protein